MVFRINAFFLYTFNSPGKAMCLWDFLQACAPCSMSSDLLQSAWNLRQIETGAKAETRILGPHPHRAFLKVRARMLANGVGW